MRYVRVKQFLEEKESVDWLIEGLLPNVGWTLFYGRKGEGKTTFAMQLCLALEQGTQFLERKTLKTPILYVQADSREIEWRDMLRRIAPKDSNAVTAIEVPAKALGIDKVVTSLQGYVERCKPGYIVFDSYYKLTAWPINNEVGTANAVMAMESIAQETPYMLIHHPPHSENRAAGHSSLANACSNEWGLLKTKLNIEKSRLTAIKEILLKRETSGLWALHTSKAEGLEPPQGYHTERGW